MKDVGGCVNEYRSLTEIYHATDREVMLHERLRLALSLANACVYPDSTLKFHLAYDPRNHQSNYDVSQRPFDSAALALKSNSGDESFSRVKVA